MSLISTPASTPITTTSQLSAKDASNPALNPLNPKGLKPCCACPETKSLRDDCFLKYNNEDDCKAFMEQHKACMKGYGFPV